jgi:hypothetical protein
MTLTILIHKSVNCKSISRNEEKLGYKIPGFVFNYAGASGIQDARCRMTDMRR